MMYLLHPLDIGLNPCYSIIKVKILILKYTLFTNINYMGIILWIIFGAIVGWIASKIMGTDAQQGVGMNVIVGIIGAVIGGWIMSFFGETPVTGFDLYSFLVAILGAVVLIAIVRAVRRVA